ncbi:MAG TPA: DUF951 family protein [Tenericutes bacterium]|jgi:hypothetical protein|nr:DUF951 family protein [Mycoplasmatota bacterium]
MEKTYNLGSIVEMRKKHPCGKNKWEVIRVGLDVRIKCLNCGRTVLLAREEFKRKLKKVIEN